MSDAYQGTCPQKVANQNTYSTSILYKKLDGFTKNFNYVSEYDLQRDNDNGWLLRISNNIPDYDTSMLKDYKFQMYVEKYPFWNL